MQLWHTAQRCPKYDNGGTSGIILFALRARFHLSSNDGNTQGKSEKFNRIHGRREGFVSLALSGTRLGEDHRRKNCRNVLMTLFGKKQRYGVMSFFETETTAYHWDR